MKMKKKLVFASACALLFFLGPSGFGQQDRKVVEFSGTAGPASDPASPGLNNPIRGIVRCVGAGNPAPADRNAPPWCPPDTRTTVKAQVMVGKWATSDPNVNGTMRWYLNFDVDSATMTGAWWGSFLLEIPGKGTWEGWVWGEQVGFQLSWRLVGIGTGAFDKSTLMAEATFEDYSAKPPIIKGRYLEPKAQ